MRNIMEIMEMFFVRIYYDMVSLKFFKAHRSLRGPKMLRFAVQQF